MVKVSYFFEVNQKLKNIMHPTKRNPAQKTVKPTSKKPETLNKKVAAPTNQPTVGKEHMIGDSIDREMHNVDSQLFQSKAPQQDTAVVRSDSNLGKISDSGANGSLKHPGTTGLTQTTSMSKKQQYRQQLDSVGATIDDSEFYRSNNMVDNTKDTLVETNIRDVLEKHMNSTLDHRPCKVPYALYEKLPMQKEGIYLKDFKPQDLQMSKPHYGDANNPYENFIPQHPPANDNSLYRRDYTSKQMKNVGEPVIRDVISSQHDFAKNLRAPKPNDTMYKVVSLD